MNIFAESLTLKMSNTGKSGSFNTDDLIPVIKFISKNWILLPIFCSISFVVAYFQSNKLPDIYGASTEILLKQNDSYDYQSNIKQTVGYYSLIQDINNQTRAITSRDLIGKVIDKLDFNISYFIVGRIRTAQVNNFGSLKIDCKWQNVHRALYNNPIYITVIDRQKYQISYETKGVKFFKELKFNEPYKNSLITLNVTLAAGISDEEFETITEQTYKFLIYSRDQLINSYASRVQVSNNTASSILTLSINDGLPELCTQFLDSLTVEYIKYTIKSQLDINSNTLKYIDKQLNELSSITDSLTYELNTLSFGGDNTTFNSDQNSIIENLKIIDKSIFEYENRIKAILRLENFFNEINTSDLNSRIFPFEYNDNYLSGLVTKLLELKQRKSNMLFDIKPADSRIKRLDNEISVLIENIRLYITHSKKQITEKNNLLEIEKDELELKINSLPKEQKEVLVIERKIAVNESLYNFLLEKRASTVIARAGIVPETTVLEKARSNGIVGPDRKRFTMLALGFGVILSLLVGIIRLIFFERIENTKELKVTTQLSIIGGVPFYNEADENPIAILSSPRSNVSESFRSIRTNLQYLLPKEDNKIILVSSLHPGEGKTFVSVNLASTFAKAGKRVIVLDFDMHKPKIHKLFKYQNVSGISSYLVNQVDWKDSLRHTEIPNLDLILAGPVPPNASELVLSQRVDTLIAELKNNYDFIIIDTPPLALISDALTMLNKVNLGLFVMNTQKATKQGVRYLEDTLQQNEISHVTLLLNNIKQNKWRYYYSKYAYKYGYGYVYGYGYGYGDGYRYGYGEYSENADKGRKKSND
jgi:tyrosine-protein kinase Etk/Wzc